MLNIPLVTLKCNNTSISSSNAAESADLQNATISALHISCNPKTPEDQEEPKFGFPPKHFNLGAGTHLIARLSREPLDFQTFRALGDFCRYHLPPFFQKCTLYGEVEYTKDLDFGLDLEDL